MNQLIFVWGTGYIAQQMLKNGMNVEINGFVETKPMKRNFEGKNVISFSELTGEEIVIIASTYGGEIFESLKQANIKIENCIFFCKCSKIDAKTNLDLAKKLFSNKNYQIYLNNYGLYEESFFTTDLCKYQELNTRKQFEIKPENNRPIITDRYDEMGMIDDSFWESTWVASRIRENNPKMHFDIGSRLNGFLSIIISMGIPLVVIDVRTFPVEIEGMTTIVDDATTLSQFDDDSIESISAVSSLEHFGLGRYGDPIDPEACFKCFKNLQKKMKIGGKLYMTVPVGEEKVCFNAHRVFNPLTIVNEFNEMTLLEFSFISEGKINRNIDVNAFANEKHDKYCNGLFVFEKRGRICL